MNVLSTIYRIVAMTVPVMMFQIIEFSNNFIDAIMMGRYDALLLGPVSLAGTFYALSVVFFVGILIITGSLIGQASGAKNYPMMVRVVQAGAMLAILFVIILLIWFINIEQVLSLLWFGDTLTEQMAAYLDGRMYALFAIMAIPFRMFLVNQKLFKQILFVNLVSLPINIVLNYTLIFGNFGVPEMGIYGAGLATGLSMCIAMVMVIICATLRGRKQNIPLWRGFPNIDMQYKKRIVKLGVGIGFLITAELILFTAINAYAGIFSPIKIAAWGVVFQIWNMLFAIVLGIAEACNIYLAEESGRRDRLAYIQGFWIYIGFMTLMCVVFAIFCVFIPQMFINIILDPSDSNYLQISTLASAIFPIMAIGFIIESYVQIIGRSLMAMSDTNCMPYVMWLSYGIIGPAVGYVWVFHFGGEVMALMITIIISLLLATVLGGWRLYYMTRPSHIFYKVKT